MYSAMQAAKDSISAHFDRMARCPCERCVRATNEMNFGLERVMRAWGLSKAKPGWPKTYQHARAPRRRKGRCDACGADMMRGRCPFGCVHKETE